MNSQTLAVPTHPSLRPVATALVLILGALAMTSAGCQRDEIRAYEAPKDESAARSMSAGHGATRTGPAQVEQPTWELPDGWTVTPGTGMRFATLLVSEEPPVEIRVTPLGAGARDALANANRWGSQIGLEPFSADDLAQVMRTIEPDGQTIELFNMVGPPLGSQPANRVLAAIVPGEQVWFFMCMGPDELVSPHRDAFDSFMQTVRLETAEIDVAQSGGGSGGTEGLPAGHPEIGSGDTMSRATTPDPPSGGSMGGGNMGGGSMGGGTAGGQAGGDGESLLWTLPAGWSELSETSQMRYATLSTGDGAEDATVVITRFPGSVGGLLANFNRWRQQVGLDPVSTLEEQPIERFSIGSSFAGLLDLTAPAESAPTDAERRRMLVTLVARPSMTWFVKMDGTNAVIDKHTDTFRELTNSLRFTGEESD